MSDLYEEDYIEDESQAYEGPAIPVHIESITAERTVEVAPEFGTCMTWTIPQVGTADPLPILQRRYHRHKAKINLNSAFVTDTQVGNPAAGTSTFIFYTSPANGSIVQSIKFTYTSDATVGNRVITLALYDGQTNLILSIPCLTAQPASTTCTVMAFIGAPNSPVASGNAIVTLPNIQEMAGWTWRVSVTGTVGAADQISAMTYTQSSMYTVVFNSKREPLMGNNPQGFTWAGDTPMPDWESQQPLFAVCIGGTATVSVVDEAYAGP